MATMAARDMVFTPASILDGEWEAAGLRSNEDVAGAVHGCLLDLRCHEAELSLVLGRGLKRFLREGDASYRMLAHSNAEDACAQRLGFSAAHARDLMDLASGVDRVPELEEPFVAGRIGPSKLKVVMGVATSESAESGVRWSRHRGVRGLAADVRAFREGELTAEGLAARVAEEPPEPEMVRVCWRMNARERVLWSFAVREMIPSMVGHRLSTSECAELLAANVLAGVPDHPEEPAGGACADAGCRKRHRLRGVKLTAERLRELKPDRSRRELPPRIELPDPALPRGAAALLDVLRILVGYREQVHAERAQLLWWLDSGSRWRHLGASSREAYALEVLGLSPKEVHASIDLATKLTFLPKLARAWRRGEVTAQVQRLITRVAEPRTQDAWLRFVADAALSRIELEVAYHEALMACASRDEYLLRTGGGMPQFQAPRSRLMMRVEKMLEPRGESGKKRKPCAAVPASEPDDALLVALQREDPMGQLRARIVSFEATPIVAAMLDTMIEVTRRELGAAASEGACVEHALRELIKDMVPPRRLLRRQLGRNLRILERDGWRCSNPLCRARSRLHVHHIVFRSHGGSDDPSNLITLCLACHALVHSGRLKIVGRAPNQVLFATPIGEVWCEGLRVAA